mmetsp:Transcript_4050/g.4146  ORF Transcript_4050/g.4146 Transcript_4050/m.4146 type:complete len:322 (+) Transcript_4050:209-1174(+)|eukprot:CAMPEP_0182428674 /NCGR_PEP_ID=MMETSP1167-20130531/23201_1 /TAXON_ID=2988 /ORGANISM="Mallomonas Sp, Strain CCMP3275" /LENGTH=321 /DNA_ID=CAMNT_0024611699 /DNA_START=209 /DNA_END=1177 /DNA_ORIENTATION=-
MVDRTENMDMDIPEWDRSEMSFLKHMLAGSIAGLAEHVSTFPVDTLKTHIQCARCGSNSPSKIVLCAKRIVHRQGLMRLWRGVSAMFAGCIPAHAAYFSIYESLKAVLRVDEGGHRPLQAAMCGASATLSHDLIMNPFDVVKQRMQLGYYRSMSECFLHVYRAEGSRAFFSSLPTTMLMNIPYGCVMVATNESAKKVLNPSGGYSVGTSLLAGCVAGAAAAAVTNPLDVIKTRIQTLDLQPLEPQPITSPSPVVEVVGAPVSLFARGDRYRSRTAYQTFRQIITEEGVSGLSRGVLPRILVQAPAVAISWTAYETAKMLMS